jgi:Asp-tRNA(Asn)/Glu-tRNA(Gln) amidotransferase A subunit family amidase
MSGREDADPLSWGSPPAEPGGLDPVRLKSLKVAISEDLGFAPLARSQRQVFRRRLGLFADVFRDVEEADPNLRGADRVFEVLRGVLYLAEHRRQLAETPDKLGPNVIANVEQGLTFSAEDVAEALVEQTAILRRFGEFMNRYDLLICPTMAVGPVARDAGHPREIDGQPLETYFSWIAMTYGLTLTAHPVITLPCGRDESGMPWGLQIVGRRGEDWRLLAAAQALEVRLAEEPECRRPRPDLAALASSGG